MKLWKSKKNSSCVPGKSSIINKNEDMQLEPIKLSTSSSVSVDRAMSPAQSEDSGLAADRNTTYATITLPRENAQAMGITFAERSDLSYPPIINSLNPLGSAADFLAPGDRIHQIDGISTIGLTNTHVQSILCHGDGPAIIEIEYSLPEYISQNSLCVTLKLAQITVERENGCLGLTLRGGGDIPMIVTHVRPHGPVFKTGRIKPGDRLLRVDNVSLVNKTLSEAQQILKCGHSSTFTNLTIEYDVSVIQSVEFSLGPLLIEIERQPGDKLGLILSNYTSLHHMDNSKDNEIAPAGVYIASILPASIADRCGALSVGDQILSVDETVIENTALTPEGVSTLLDGNLSREFTQIQILPVHAMLRRLGLQCASPKHGFGTMNSRKVGTTSRTGKFTRKSSLPLENTNTLYANQRLCRTESVQVVLDCSNGSGICLGSQSPCGRGYIITQILEDSVAERSGCIQKGDRLLSINKLYNLDQSTIRQILGDVRLKNSHQTTHQSTNWVEIEIEFDITDFVVPSSGIFNVKLAKNNRCGLGITVNGSNHGTFIITEVKRGSSAYRTGSLRTGDILLAVDSLPLQHFNIDQLLKENKNDFTMLTIKRNSLPDFLFDAQQSNNNTYSMEGSTNSDENKYKYINNNFSEMRIDSNGNSSLYKKNDNYFQSNEGVSDSKMVTQIRRPYFSRMTEMATTSKITDQDYDDTYNDPEFYNIEYPPHLPGFTRNTDAMISSQINQNTQQIITVILEAKGGPLGLTLAGSEDLQKPILISGLTEGGVAYKTGKLKIGDEILSINNENVQRRQLSHSTKLLQKYSDDIIELKISRNIINDGEYNKEISTQPLYSQIQRRPRSPSIMDTSSNTSRKGKYQTLHVTLYKDKVYDDYGFSVSDGLYEKGVFINRIRSGGPADMTGMLNPFDRIVQVNDTKTQDFDCCLTVPLIAAAGDQINLVVERPITEQN